MKKAEKPSAERGNIRFPCVFSIEFIIKTGNRAAFSDYPVAFYNQVRAEPFHNISAEKNITSETRIHLRTPVSDGAKTVLPEWGTDYER